MSVKENGPNNSLSRKTQGIMKICQNTGNCVCFGTKFPILMVQGMQVLDPGQVGLKTS